MGLAERRAIKNFQEQHYPALKKAIDDAAGFAIPVDVQWETLAVEEMAHLYDECFPKVYFQPLAQAFRAICVDEMGRDALKAGLKQIVVKNTGERSSAPGCYDFTAGVLSFDHKPTTNVDDYGERTKSLVTLLESKL